MKILGPGAFAKSEVKMLLRGLRSFAVCETLDRRQIPELINIQVNNAITERHDTIFTQPEWIELLEIDSSWCPRQSLMDIASKIPRIIARTDGLPKQFTTNSTSYNHYQEAQMLLDEMRTIHARFEAWLARYESLFHDPLFWSTSGQSYSVDNHNDRECRPKYSPESAQLTFHSAPVAGILTAYASFRLGLWKLAADLRQRIRMFGPEDEEAHSESRNELLKQESDAAKKTAWLILEAMPYLSSCFEGSLVLQGPLKIVEEYYRRDGLVAQ